MVTKLICPLLMIIGLATGCYSYPAAWVMGVSPLPTPTLVGWRQVGLPGRFTFSVPPDLQEKVVHGIDSYIESYVSDDLRLHLDYGIYSGPFARSTKAAYQEEWVDIDGVRAMVVTFYSEEALSPLKYVAGVHFADVQSRGKSIFAPLPITLTLYAECKGPEQQELAKQIFQTIDFGERWLQWSLVRKR